ncbi:protein Churchill-like [Ruditapes philippinarum]|uniref:protein Churchill-like n=1 Tax=Ruditapes philippinarum TaxID=129788 RepID=UPI00295AFFE9|nr:protein Churchill-like [Ruditapes philippinarum]
MCNACVKEEFPDRESICLDNGSYMLNFAGCANCGEKSSITTINRQTSEDDADEEIITYQHICQSCSHVVANHEHVFRIEEDYQVYEMLCLLCGRSDDQRSILPCDPRGPKPEHSDFD